MKRSPHRDRVLDFAPETLETRAMLAGNIDVSVMGGTLTLSGDGQDNILAITQYNDQLVVIGIETTISDATFSDSLLGIDFDIKLIDGVNKDVNILLRGGDDIVVMGASLTESAGPEGTFDGDISIDTLQLARDLKIWTGGGRDAVVVAGTEVGRNLVIDTGFGLHDFVAVGGGGIASAALDFISELALDDFLVGIQGSVNSLSGDGALTDDLIIDAVNVLLGEVNVGRDLIISGHSSDDSVYVGGVNVERDAIVNTNIGEDSIYFGVGADIEVSIPWLEDNLKSLFDATLLDEINITGHVDVGRRAFINSGDGDDITRIGGAVGYSFELPDIEPQDGGADGDFYYFSMSGGVDVGNDLSFTAGNNDDNTYIAVQPSFQELFQDDPLADGREGDSFNVRVGRNMRIDLMADDDFLQIGGSASEEELSNGLGFGWTFVEQALGVDGNLTILTGPGTDEVVMGEQEPIIIDFLDPTFSEGEGLIFYQIDVGNNLILSTGGHDDSVSIAGHAFLYEYGGGNLGPNGDSLGTLRVGRNMRVDTDGGNDSFEMGHTSQVEPNGNVGTFFDFAAITIERDLRINTGDQDDQVTLDETSVGDDVSMDTGWGRDSIDIGSEDFIDRPALGQSSGFYSNVSIGDRLIVFTSLERDTIDITNTHIGGTARLQTGLQDDTVRMSDVQIGNDLLVITERGNDEVFMEYVFVDDQLRVLTGAQSDNVELFQVVGSRLNIDTSTENDRVCVFDSSFGTATLNGGRGDADELGTNLSTFTQMGFELVADCDK